MWQPCELLYTCYLLTVLLPTDRVCSPPLGSASATAKGVSAPPAKKGHEKKLSSPVGDSAQPARENDEKSAEIVSTESEAAVSDSSADIIPELVPCAAEPDPPVVSVRIPIMLLVGEMPYLLAIFESYDVRRS